MISKCIFSFLLLDLNLLDPEIIYTFLKECPKVIEDFVRDHVTLDQLEIWLSMKSIEQQHKNIDMDLMEGK